MPYVAEAANDREYDSAMEDFKLTLPKGSKQQEFSDERSKGDSSVRRFVAFSDVLEISGWMITKSVPEGVKIEGICTHTNPSIKKGTLKALVTRAVNMSLKEGKRGVVILTDVSSDEGKAYTFLGFTPTDSDGRKMRLEAGNWPAPKWKEVEEVPSKKGKKMWRTELETIA